MARETKQVALCIKKVLRSSIRKSYRFVSEHPVLFSLGVLLYLLYRSLPGLFVFLLSSSPVIICATLLLGILLSYGDTKFPEANEDAKTTTEISAFKAENSSRLEANQRISVPGDKNNTENFKEKETKRSVPVRERSSEHVPLLRRVDDEDEKFERRDIPKTLTPFPSMVNFRQEIGLGEELHINQVRESRDLPFMTENADRHTSLFEGLYKKDASFFMLSSSENANKHGDMDDKLNPERVFTDSAADRDRDISQVKPTDVASGTGRPTCAVSVRQRKKLDGLNIDISKAVEDNLLDSPLGSPWARVGSQDGSSGFDSDRAESSSPDASMTEIAPVLDEIDPLLGADSTHPDPVCMDDTDTDSHISSQDHPTDDDSNGEDANNDAKDSGEENKKDDRKEAAFIWTADDEKNLMDLGYSEMERNRRLEILMVRRRSRKNIIFEIDNNSIDVNSNDAGRSVDDLARFRAQVPHISVTRRNPFDLSYDPEEAAIPGSAPSVLHSRKNPFDLLLEHPNDSGVSAPDNLSSGESVITSHRDMFRRHESFNFGSTDATQERRSSRLKPYFVPEAVEGSIGNFQRQFSDKSESKLSSVTESDMTSSVADQDNHKDLDEKDVHREHESPILLRQDSDLADVGSECSDGINSVDVELDHSEIDERESALQHFVFERSQEREAYLASTKGKGHEEDYMLKSAGNSMMPLHPVADLLSWEDGHGESYLGARSSLEPNPVADFSEWVSSPATAEEHEPRSGDLGLGATSTAEKDGSFGFISYSNNEISLDNMVPGSLELLSDFGKETFPEISRDLHPIPEERVVEHFNMQESHETAIFTDSATALADLHVIEEHFDVGSEVSPSSAVVSLCPPEANDSIQSPLVEPKDFSNPFFFMASEPDRVGMVDLEEEKTSGYQLDSDDDGEKIYPEPLEDNGIDESFLSELDAVGDFGLTPMRLDQQVSDIGSHTDNPANDVPEDSLIIPQTSGDINVSDVSALHSCEMSPLVDYPSDADPVFSWSLRASHDDPEQTVYNPRRRILEAMNTELNLPRDETEVPSVNTPSAAYLAVKPSEPEVTQNQPLTTTKTDDEMMVVDAKSLEDIETAFKQASDGSVEEPNLDTETSHISGVDVESESLEGPGQLHATDTKSVNDICSALKEHSGVDVNSSLEQNEDKNGCGETAELARDNNVPEGTHVESLHVVDDDREPELMKTASSMSSIDANALDDHDAGFKRISDVNDKSTVHAMESENGWKRREEVNSNELLETNAIGVVNQVGTDPS